MPSKRATLADAVATLIGTGSYTVTPTISRSSTPRNDLTSSAFHIDVLIGDDTAEKATRSSQQHDYLIHVVLQKKVANELNATIDPLSYITEQIQDLLFNTAPAGVSERCFKCEITVAPRSNIEEDRIWSEAITATYRGFR